MTTVIAGVTHIDSGVTVLEIQDERGDVWEKVSQIAWFIEGKLTPAGKLADFFMMDRSFNV